MRRISSSATHIPDAYASDDIGIYTMNDFGKKKQQQNKKTPPYLDTRPRMLREAILVIAEPSGARSTRSEAP